MNKFNERIEKLLPTTAILLSEIDKLNGQWIGGANLNPLVLDRLRNSVLITSTGSSTRIEGSKLSDEEVEKLMRGLKLEKLTDRDAQEVRGYYELLQTVFESYDGIQISESLIKQLHSELLKYANKDERHRGEYKKLENSVAVKDASGQVFSVIFDTTPAFLVPKEMNELVAWTKESLMDMNYHPLLIIANFVIEFLKIHPFLDGNGRLSRVLTNLLMIQAGYKYMPYVSHEKLIENKKTEYYLALRQSQTSFKSKGETIVPWTTFFLTVLREQAKQAIQMLLNENDNIENLLSPNQLKVWAYINSTAGETSIQEITDATKVARPTVRQAIERLIILKKIQRMGMGRTTRYRKIKIN